MHQNMTKSYNANRLLKYHTIIHIPIELQLIGIIFCHCLRHIWPMAFVFGLKYHPFFQVFVFCVIYQSLNLNFEVRAFFSRSFAINRDRLKRCRNFLSKFSIVASDTSEKFLTLCFQTFAAGWGEEEDPQLTDNIHFYSSHFECLFTYSCFVLFALFFFFHLKKDYWQKWFTIILDLEWKSSFTIL